MNVPREMMVLIQNPAAMQRFHREMLLADPMPRSLTFNIDGLRFTITTSGNGTYQIAPITANDSPVDAK